MLRLQDVKMIYFGQFCWHRIKAVKKRTQLKFSLMGYDESMGFSNEEIRPLKTMNTITRKAKIPFLKETDTLYTSKKLNTKQKHEVNL